MAHNRNFLEIPNIKVKATLMLAASLTFAADAMAQQTFSPESVVKACDVVRTDFVAETVGLYQGNGEMGCTYAPLGLHWHTDYTNKYGETKLVNLNHRVRARYHHDYLVPLLQVYWNDFPNKSAATGITGYEQRQSFYDGTVDTRFTAKGVTYSVKTWFDPVEPSLGFININASEAGTKITVDPMENPQAHYSQKMVQQVSLAKEGDNTYRVTVNCKQWQQNGTHDCYVPHSSDVYVSTNATMSVENNNIVISLAKGDNYVCLSYGKPAAITPKASLAQTSGWWHGKWDEQGMISVSDKNAENTWVRSVAMFLSSYDDRKNGLCPPLSFSGTNWSFYYPQDVSYVHPVFLSTGNLSIARSWIEKWATEIDGQRDYTKRIYKQDGVMIPWVYPYNGFEGYHEGGFPMHTYAQIHQGAYYVRMALQVANLVNDAAWTSTYAMPVLKGVAEFYSNIATKHDDGYWHLYNNPSSGQDEFGGDNRTDYVDVLYSAQYVLQQAVEHGIDPNGRYSQILKDGLAFPALLDPTGSYYYAFLGGENTFGSQKHPSQLNELIDDPVYSNPSNPAIFVYLKRNEMTIDASKPFYWGWTLGAFLLSGSRLGLTEQWKADWENMRKSDYVDSEWIQSFETSTHWNMSYYNINNGFIAQSLLCNLVDDWYGRLEIGKCNPWEGTQYFRNIVSQLGVNVSGTVDGKDYDVMLTAWKDCSFKLYDQEVNLKKGESKRFKGTAPDFKYDIVIPVNYSLEAEKASFQGGARVSSDNDCSGGARLGYLGKGATVTFNYDAKKKGLYDLTLFYMTSNDRFFEINVNGGETITTPSLNSGGWNGNSAGRYTLQIELQEGNNEITLGNANDDAPNLDKIELSFNEKATSISIPTQDQRRQATYTIGGQRVQGKPSAPGLYIENGRKVIKE